MRAIAFLVSLFVLSSVASAQVTRRENRMPQPQEEQSGWVQIPSPTNVTINRIVSQPNGTIWFGNSEGIFRSRNLGDSWTKIPGIDRGVVDFFDDSDGVITSQGTVKITSDGGETWIPANPTETNSGAPNVVHPNSVFVVSGSNISKSKDRGKTWLNRQVDASSIGPISFCDSSYGVVVGSIDLETSGTAFKTNDAGESWVRMQTPRYNFHDVYLLSRDTIFIVSLNGHVFRSIDGGVKWDQQTLTPIGEGLDAITFTNNREGYVAGAHGVIFYTPNAGENWISQTIPTTRTLTELTFVNDSVGFAAGEGGLIFRTKTGGRSSVHTLPQALPIMLNIYPEPSRSDIRVEYALPEVDNLSLDLYSSDGRLVRTILSATRQEKGKQSILIDGRSIASGTYFLQLKGIKYTATGRITIIR